MTTPPRRDTGRVRLPALPAVAAQDVSMHAWMQAVQERLEVREGSRGNPMERAVTLRELQEYGGTTQAGKSTNNWLNQFKNIDQLADALRGTTVYDDLLRRIGNAGDSNTIGLNLGGNATSPGNQPTVPASGGNQPEYLTLARNDLDFWFLPPVTGGSSKSFIEFTCTVDTRPFFSAVPYGYWSHIVFAIGCEGEQGHGLPHRGPIIRYGHNLFEYARGFIVWNTGEIQSEHWQGSQAVTATRGSINLASYPIFTIRIVGGYRSGATANFFTLQIHNGGPHGQIIFQSANIGYGWDFNGIHQAAVGAIAAGFVSPNDTGNVERTGAGFAPNARLPISGPMVTVY